MLCYFPKGVSPSKEFHKWLDTARVRRESRGREMVRRLNNLSSAQGGPVILTWDECCAINREDHGTMGRPQIGRALMKKGWVRPVSAARPLGRRPFRRATAVTPAHRPSHLPTHPLARHRHP